MSIVQLNNLCSHLQNASLARLGLTSIPHTRMHLALSIQLHKQGFISNIVLGGPTPPAKLLPPTDENQELRYLRPRGARPLSEGAESDESPSEAARSGDVLPEAEDPNFPINELFPAANLHPTAREMLKSEAHKIEDHSVTQTNRSSRRLWLGLKYWDGEPVMRKVQNLSKPTQKLWLSHEDLSKIVRGRRANYVSGMTKIGECMFLSTDKGIMEARECVERRIGGMVLCRVWG